MTQKSAAMHLEASFDIDQVSDQLMWHFVRYDDKGNPLHGKEAGLINFTIGEQFFVNVIAGSAKPIAGVRIIECVLITKPFIYQCGPDVKTIYAPPSPFGSAKLGGIMSASIVMPGDQFKAGLAEESQCYHYSAHHWDRALTVGGFQGRWDISFVLTVQIARPDGRNELRVFSFDPEGEVSNGAVPPQEEEPCAPMLEPESDPTHGGA